MGNNLKRLNIVNWSLDSLKNIVISHASIYNYDYVFADFEHNFILKTKYGTYLQYIKAILNYNNSSPYATIEEKERIKIDLSKF